MQVTACLLLAIVAVTSSSAANVLDGLQVLTQQGNVAGTLILPTVRQFLGVPYASAKRWEAPGLPPTHLSTIQATQFGDSCIQLHSPADLEFGILANSGGFNLTESEDCLTVNIWAPSVQRKQKTAVMLWVYGGAFQFGTSHLPSYVGTHFVRDNDDLVLVTFNYRLNIFGQPNAPQLQSNTVSQNFGLLDLDAAVNWVHANIAAFGGDPDRITIFGQSAGSLATDAYAFAHPHDTIVKGIIQESGSLGLLGAQGSPAVDPTNWNTVATAVDCGTTNDAKQLACMKAVPAATLEAAVLKSNVLFNLFADNITIFADTAARSAAGNFLHAPLLGGTTLNEGDVFVIDQETLIIGSAPPMITEVLADLTTQIAFTCPAGQTAQSRFNAQVPTWRYQYQAVFPDISTRPDLRAYHASEISLVFGSYNESFPTIPSTPTEVALSHFVQSAWVAFARDPQMGLVNFGWPMYNPSTNTLAQIGHAANQTGIVFTSGAQIDLTCSAAALLFNISSQLGDLLKIGPIQI